MVKVISLSEDAYKKLRALKGERSFSDVVIELVETNPKRNIMEFAGIWAERSDEWEKIKEAIYKDRKKLKLRTYKI